MAACTFFGHRDCYGLDVEVLQRTIAELIETCVDTFYVGHQGQFDSMVLHCLKTLRKVYPHIQFSVVLAYMPTQKPEYDLYKNCSIYPEGLEAVPPKFAIEARNKWMIARLEYCICYVNRNWGGAHKFSQIAKRRDLQVINLATIELLQEATN